MIKLLYIIGGVVIIVVAVIGGILISMSNYGPPLEEVRHLTTPRIVSKPTVNAIVVEAVGDPNTTHAFGLLFKTYYKIKGVPKGKKMEAPRARWTKPLETPKDQWLGFYAMPVPSSVTTLPDVKSSDELTISLKEWEYGEVAEILHIGSYSREKATVDKLKQFIAEEGYEICGAHEEEYLKGPSFIPTNPEKYLTIIRYRVKKVKSTIHKKKI